VCSGGIAKALGLDDGPTHGKSAIAKLRLTLPPRKNLASHIRSEMDWLRFDGGAEALG
jgi:hypothetical protein